MVNTSQLITKVTRETGIPISRCAEAINVFIEQMAESLSNGEKVVIPNFVVFDVQDLPEKRRRNPVTGDVEVYPPSKTIKCRINKKIKDELKKRAQGEK